MSECNSCPSKNSCTSKDTCMIKDSPHSSIKNVIGVMSGKGGVGKSTVSVMMAQELNKRGFKVGILDADITGPSIPRLLRISDKKATANELGIIPVNTDTGIKVVSLNLLMEDENQPVIWRGPLIAGIVEQFWTDVIWGELDYLIIDMPPGTGDVALTAMQSIPISGIVMVSVPQDLVSMIVSKAINMVKKMNIPVLGLVENMSYIKCPDCDRKIRIFESENISKFLEENNIELLGELPMCKDIANISEDRGQILNEDINKTFKEIGDKLIGF